MYVRPLGLVKNRNRFHTFLKAKHIMLSEIFPIIVVLYPRYQPTYTP